MFLTCAEEVNGQLFIICRRSGVPPFGIYLDDVPGKNQKLGTYFTRDEPGRDVVGCINNRRKRRMCSVIKVAGTNVESGGTEDFIHLRRLWL